MRPAPLLAAAWFAACAALPASGQDDLEDALEGFDEDTEAPVPRDEAPAADGAPGVEPWWELTGDATLGLSYRPSHDPPSPYHGLTRAQAQLALPGRHPGLGPVTLRQLLSAWVVHDLGHIAQVSRVMAKQYRDAIGPWVPYLPVVSDRPVPAS